MKYFDSHAHYWDSRFSENSESTEQLIGALLSDSVSGIVNVGTDPTTSRLALSQAEKFSGVYATAGIHPSDTRFLSDLEDDLSDIQSLIVHNPKKIVALGEIGLDYHYEDTDKAKQARYFDAQLSLAESLGIPVIIHDREAHGDVMEIIDRHPRVQGVFHSFSGSAEMAAQLVRRGWMISFSGTVSFKNAAKVRAAAAVVPNDFLLIETDAPYLTPHPHRGERNDSSYLSYTAAALADAKGIDLELCAEITEKNAFFRI